MSSESELVIESLNRNHNRTIFNCGVESLDRYLKRQANQDMRRQISRVFVARAFQDETRVLGYYTLSAFSIDLSVLPDKIAKKLPRHPVPSALIGRLAVDTSARGQGIGEMLLSDAIKRTLAVSDDIAIYAMVVDAIDPQAESFYKRYGFSRLAHGGSRLFLPLRSL
jgi:ribosomal protein S18 acetylase RimI-like enzyme